MVIWLDGVTDTNYLGQSYELKVKGSSVLLALRKEYSAPALDFQMSPYSPSVLDGVGRSELVCLDDFCLWEEWPMDPWWQHSGKWAGLAVVGETLHCDSVQAPGSSSCSPSCPGIAGYVRQPWEIFQAPAKASQPGITRPCLALWRDPSCCGRRVSGASVV